MAVPARLASPIPSGPRQSEASADSSTWSRCAPGRAGFVPFPRPPSS